MEFRIMILKTLKTVSYALILSALCGNLHAGQDFDFLTVVQNKIQDSRCDQRRDGRLDFYAKDAVDLTEQSKDHIAYVDYSDYFTGNHPGWIVNIRIDEELLKLNPYDYSRLHSLVMLYALKHIATTNPNCKQVNWQTYIYTDELKKFDLDQIYKKLGGYYNSKQNFFNFSMNQLSAFNQVQLTKDFQNAFGAVVGKEEKQVLYNELTTFVKSKL